MKGLMYEISGGFINKYFNHADPKEVVINDPVKDRFMLTNRVGRSALTLSYIIRFTVNPVYAKLHTSSF
jgi:hypothetical protein